MIAYLKEKITSRAEGYISFCEFMSDCLYHSEYGYYMRQSEKIGKSGDFYTSSSVHPVFAETFVSLVVTIFEQKGGAIYFCEMGGGTGVFAKQFLDVLQKKYPTHYEKVSYYLIEKSEYLQSKQKELLANHNNHTTWFTDLGQLEMAYKGVFFSNELVDAFPVHIVEEKNGKMLEVAITWSEEEQEFQEILVELTNVEIQEYLNNLGIPMQSGQRLEIPLEALAWAEQVASVIEEGVWLTVDYGYTNEELKLPHYRRGSLLCYDQHQVDENALDKPGEKDITYHIHFDMLYKAVEKFGWHRISYDNQSQFLLKSGILQFLEEHSGGDPFQHDVIKKNRAIRHFISPESISGSFHVLSLAKGSYRQCVRKLEEPFSISTMLS
jgi:SAM-dependent MidA family methyltransferase